MSTYSVIKFEAQGSQHQNNMNHLTWGLYSGTFNLWNITLGHSQCRILSTEVRSTSPLVFMGCTFLSVPFLLLSHFSDIDEDISQCSIILGLKQAHGTDILSTLFGYCYFCLSTDEDIKMGDKT